MPEDDVLRSLPNLLATPHLGYVSQANYRTYFREAVEDIQAFLSGSPIRELDGEKPHHISNATYNKDQRYFKIGGGGGSSTETFTLKDINNNTYFLIKWKTINGDNKEELIELEIDADLPMVQQIKNGG